MKHRIVRVKNDKILKLGDIGRQEQQEKRWKDIQQFRTFIPFQKNKQRDKIININNKPPIHLDSYRKPEMHQ